MSRSTPSRAADRARRGRPRFAGRHRTTIEKAGDDRRATTSAPDPAVRRPRRGRRTRRRRRCDGGRVRHGPPARQRSRSLPVLPARSGRYARGAAGRRGARCPDPHVRRCPLAAFAVFVPELGGRCHGSGRAGRSRDRQGASAGAAQRAGVVVGRGRRHRRQYTRGRVSVDANASAAATSRDTASAVTVNAAGDRTGGVGSARTRPGRDVRPRRPATCTDPRGRRCSGAGGDGRGSGRGCRRDAVAPRDAGRAPARLANCRGGRGMASVGAGGLTAVIAAGVPTSTGRKAASATLAAPPGWGRMLAGPWQASGPGASPPPKYLEIIYLDVKINRHENGA